LGVSGGGFKPPPGLLLGPRAALLGAVRECSPGAHEMLVRGLSICYKNKA